MAGKCDGIGATKMGKDMMTRGVSAAWGTPGTHKLCSAALQMVRRSFWAFLLAWMAFASPQLAQAFAPSSGDLPTIARSALPAQGLEVLNRIESGEAFSHPKDGSVFGNRERLLPKQARGYYREYTVPTPGLKHRGARRIVCGGKPKRKPDACYYTEDHYASFKLIAQ